MAKPTQKKPQFTLNPRWSPSIPTSGDNCGTIVGVVFSVGVGLAVARSVVATDGVIDAKPGAGVSVNMLVAIDVRFAVGDGAWIVPTPGGG